MYAVAYLYEHRENANYKELTLFCVPCFSASERKDSDGYFKAKSADFNSKRKYTTDDVGNVLRQWQDFYSCFASIKTTGGKERQKGDTEEQQTVSFTVRFCKKLSELSAVDSVLCSEEKTTT